MWDESSSPQYILFFQSIGDPSFALKSLTRHLLKKSFSKRVAIMGYVIYFKPLLKSRLSSQAEGQSIQGRDHTL
jgi:hypothetical protein